MDPITHAPLVRRRRFALTLQTLAAALLAPALLAAGPAAAQHLDARGPYPGAQPNPGWQDHSRMYDRQHSLSPQFDRRYPYMPDYQPEYRRDPRNPVDRETELKLRLGKRKPIKPKTN